MDRIAGLCPTAWRPKLVANALACWQAQDWRGPRRLFILDDSGQGNEQSGEDWEIHVVPGPAESLAAKYDWLWDHALEWGATIVAVWEDDDAYLPWHLSAAVESLYRGKAWWAHPRYVLSTYSGRLEREPSGGRFHAALVATVEALRAIGGWPRTRRADFDQQLLGRLRAAFGPAADPTERHQPSYVFRWADTGSPHAQAKMSGPEDETWYGRAWQAAYEACQVPLGPAGWALRPEFDEVTRRIYSWVVDRVAPRRGLPTG